MKSHPSFLVLILMSAVFLKSPPLRGGTNSTPNAPTDKPSVPVSKPWTLHDLILFATENSYAVQMAKQSKQLAEWGETKALSSFWPTLTLNTSHGFRNQNPSAYETNESSSAALVLSQNLWHQGIDQSSLQIARLDKQKAEIEFFQQRDKLCLNLTQEFYRYSLLIKSLEIQKEQQKLLNRQLEQVSSEYQQGTRSRRDFLRFKSQSQRAELEVQAKIVLIEKSRLTLAAMAGLKEDIEVQVFKAEDSQPPLLDLFKHPAELNNTYERQLIDLSLKRTDLQRDLNLKGLRWTLNFDVAAQTGSTNYWNTGNQFGDQQSRSWNAMLVFNWTLFDGGAIQSNQNIAQLQAERQKLSTRQEDLNLTSEILKLRKQFLQQKLNFKTSEESLILEQNNFHFIEGEYRQSRASYLDYISGMKDLADAQNRHWSNIFDLKQGIALYHYYRGTIYRYLMDDKSTDDKADDDEGASEEI